MDGVEEEGFELGAVDGVHGVAVGEVGGFAGAGGAAALGGHDHGVVVVFPFGAGVHFHREAVGELDVEVELVVDGVVLDAVDDGVAGVADGHGPVAHPGVGGDAPDPPEAQQPPELRPVVVAGDAAVKAEDGFAGLDVTTEGGFLVEVERLVLEGAGDEEVSAVEIVKGAGALAHVEGGAAAQPVLEDAGLFVDGMAGDAAAEVTDRSHGAMLVREQAGLARLECGKKPAADLTGAAGLYSRC